MGGVVFCRDSMASPSMALYSVVEEKSPAHLSKGAFSLVGQIRWLTRLLGNCIIEVVEDI